MPLQEQENGKKKSVLPSFFVILGAFLLAFLPILIQTFISFSTPESYSSVAGVVNVSSRKENDFQNYYLVGDVEFYYDQWIVTDDAFLEEPLKTYLPTPGSWMEKDFYGQKLNSLGFASYRYVVTGLTPGTKVFPYRNIDIPNRIYLNRILCSQTGNPDKLQQSSFVSLANAQTLGVIVPESGMVEYVLEVGNMGEGGATHIGCLHLENTLIFDMSNPIYGSISFGIIAGITLVSFALIFLARSKGTAFLLLGIAGCGMMAYFCSKDSIFAGFSIFYSAPFFEVFIVMHLAIAASLTLLYTSKRRGNPFLVYERVVLYILLALSSLCFLFAHGSFLENPFLILLVLTVGYMMVRSLVAYLRRRAAPHALTLFSSLTGFLLLLLAFNFNIYTIPFVYYPALLSVILVLCAFGVGFREIHSYSLFRADQDKLRLRYQEISSRALARLPGEEGALACLSYIGKEYEESGKKGDRALVEFSSLMRKRLMALRREKMPFAEECSLESEIYEMNKKVLGYKGELLLDYERGEIEVPPLLFREAIGELAPKLEEGETIILEERGYYVGISFPPRLSLSEEETRSIDEKASLLWLGTQSKKGHLVVFWKVRP